MKPVSLLFLSVLAGVGLSACAASESGPSAKAVTTPAAGSPQAPVVVSDPSALVKPGKEMYVRMSRSGCFGRCPSYSVRIEENGAVEFTGERFVAASGIQRGQADPQKLKALHDLLQQSDVAVLEGEYTPADKARCGRWATDLPSAKIEIAGGAFPRNINHYMGCDDAPKSLRLLEKAIDDAAGVEQWVGVGVTQ